MPNKTTRGTSDLHMPTKQNCDKDKRYKDPSIL